LGLNWSSLLGSASTESVASFEHCPWASSLLRIGYPLIGHWYWEQSLSSLYAAIYTDGRPASLCCVMSNHQKSQLRLQLCIILVVLACGVFISIPNHPWELDITFKSSVPQ
jgi:hypothetical protein